MELYPSIDLRGGRVVRLRQGDFADETVYGDDPVATARGFADAGAAWIHVVDLDAARTGSPANGPIVEAIAAAVPAAQVQCGGGVRDIARAQALWDAGVARVVVGTAAVSEPALVDRLAALRPGGVAVGLDTRHGEVATHGWEKATGLAIGDLVGRFEDAGAAALVVTEITRDAMLGGPDLTGLQSVLDLTSLDVIASGGVASASDLTALAGLRGVSGRRLAGAIVGKAIYEGRLTVAEGVAACAASV